MSLLTVGGSDSGGGAGTQADVKTFSSLGHHGTSAITCVTAQNTEGVHALETVSPDLIERQVVSARDDFEIDAAKTGALPTAEIAALVGDLVGDLPLVIDPVVAAEAGGDLSSEESVVVVRKELLPVADVVTPNVEEAEALTGIPVEGLEGAESAALELLDLGASAAVVTGGHLVGEPVDLVATDFGISALHGSRVPGRFHGTGCTFSAALAASLAEGKAVLEAASFAKDFTESAIRRAHDVGSGPRPVEPLAWVIGGLR